MSGRTISHYQILGKLGERGWSQPDAGQPRRERNSYRKRPISSASPGIDILPVLLASSSAQKYWLTP